MLNQNNFDVDHFKTLNILIDSEVSVIRQESKTSAFITKIYKRSPYSKLISEPFGIWTEESGFSEQMTDKITPNRRKNLQGTVLKSCIVITHNGSLKHLTDKREKHIDTISKVNYVFMLHLRDMFNATMMFTIQNTWGYKENKTEWSGMIGELTRKEADIGGTPLFLTSDRVAIIDYIAMTTPTKSKFVFRQPKLSYITNVFTLPFDRKVWIFAVLMVIILTIALFCIIKWEWFRSYKLKIRKKQDETVVHSSFIDVSFLAMGAVCQQGSSVIPRNTSGRIITIVLFISLMFLYNSYSANIVALLQSSSTSIQTLKDLLDSRLQVGVDDTVFNHFYFPVSFGNCTKNLKRK